MPVIIVKVREGVLKDKETKARCISALADAFAQTIGRPEVLKVTTVLIEEIPDDCWGREGRQVSG